MMRNDWKQLKMSGCVWKCLEMTGNCLKWLKIAENGENNVDGNVNEDEDEYYDWDKE